MNNIKYIDITQLPDDLWQDAKNVIALDSNGEVIKAAKEDTYSKEEIDDLLKDAEISADKLQNKIKIDSASTDYAVTQPTVSGDSLVITDAMSDKNQYHTFGYDKTITTTSYSLLDYYTPLFRGANDYNCPQWDGNTIRFTYETGISLRTLLAIPYTYNGVKYVTYFDIDFRNQMYVLNFMVLNDQHFEDYQSVKFKESEVYKAFGANGTFVFKTNNTIKDYSVLSPSMDSTYDFIYDGMNIEMTIGNFPLNASNGALIIETPRFYLYTNNVLMGYVPNESQSYRHPEKMSDYIRYSNDVKAYILTDKNTKFKTINGEHITGDGNIEVSANVDLSDYATKEELATKQDKLVSGTNIKSINGTSLLSSGNMELATKEELNAKQNVISDLDSIRSGAALGATALQSVPSGYATEQWVNEQGFLKEHQDISNLATKAELATKQDVITDLETIRSGAELGATALQSVPSTYALKTDIPDITTKQDKLVSGSNIKTVNGTSLLGSGNIVIESSADNVPTVQTTPNGTTSNYIYSTISYTNPQYSVISDISNFITYSTDKASIATWKQYWGEESSNSHQNWSINAATTSKAGLMSSSDKTKLDGIDLSTKQDTLVSGTNIKTINGTSLLGSGNIEVAANVDLSGYATKEELNAKQDTLVSGSNIKTVNGTSLLGSGNIVIEASAANVPTLQTTVEGTTNNYIYSSGRNDKYGVISDIKNLVSYEEDKASINTGWVYWGTSSVIDAAYGWSINAATTSQAGLMSASDKTKLDGINLATKQDTLVSGTNIKTVNGTSLLGSGNISIDTNVDLSNYATKSELNAKQDVINDLETIRSGAALGATALQSVPDTYALKSDIPDITTKQDKLISGENIKTINGTSLLGSGNIEVAKEWIGTQAQYDALSTKDNNTTYYITE